MKVSKSKLLKTISAIVTATIGIASLQPAQATILNASGRVSALFVADLTTYGANSNNLTLVGVSSLGNCGSFFGSVVFRIRDDAHGQQIYATALAAAASGNTVTVQVDDAIRDGTNSCFVTGLSFTGS